MPDRLTQSIIGFVLLIIVSAITLVVLLRNDYSEGDVILIVSILAGCLLLGVVSTGINWRRRNRNCKGQN